MQYRSDIQGLRSIAVLFVFLFHINPVWLPGGFIGVDIFFVISGFLISSIILSQKEKGNFSFLQFYKNRIKRIVPAYYFLLLAIAIASVFIYLGVDIARLRLALLHSDIFNSNSYFSSLDTYFGADTRENPLLHTWTLAVEMKFYVFLPMLLMWVKRKWLPAVTIGLTVALFTYTIIGISNGNKDVLYFSLLARTPEFLLGVLASFLVRKKPAINPALNTVLNFSGFALITASAFFINENSAFPGALALLPCMGTAFIIVCPHKYTLPLLTNKPMVFIGAISYSVYLWHWPVMAYIRYYYNISDFSAQQMVFVVAFTILLSLASYYLVENVFRKGRGMKLWGSLFILLALNLILSNSVVKLNKKLEYIPLDYTAPSMGLESHGRDFKNIQTFGDTTCRDKILLIGDSHANSMKPYMDYMGKNNRFSFQTITNANYPAIPGIPKEKFSTRRLHERYEKIKPYVEDLIGSNEIIILVTFHESASRDEDAIASFIHSLDPGKVLLLISDYPTLDKNPVRINRDYIKDPKRRNVYTRIFGEPGEKVMAAINSRENAYYIDLSGAEIFETAPFHNDTLMYYDEDHLNTYGSVQYAKDTEQEFMKYLDSAREYIRNMSFEL